MLIRRFIRPVHSFAARVSAPRGAALRVAALVSVLAMAGAAGVHANALPAASLAANADKAAAPREPETGDDHARAGSQAPAGTTTVDQLFNRLAETGDEVEGEGITRRIEEQWLLSGSPTADLLMRRALAATLTGDQPLGVELLDRVIAIRPGWAEAWSRRAAVFTLMGDDGRAVVDLKQALALEPRHFLALAALGAIFSNDGDNRNALKAFRGSLALNPFQPELKKRVERLSLDVDGRDL